MTEAPTNKTFRLTDAAIQRIAKKTGATPGVNVSAASIEGAIRHLKIVHPKARVTRRDFQD